MTSQQTCFNSSQEIPHDLVELCVEFVFLFSRFEYALKENGFLRKSKYKNAKPSWKKFTEEYRSTYVPSVEARELIGNPPERQVVVEGACQWEKMDLSGFTSDLDKVVFILKTIRSHLFHGGKTSHPDWDNPDKATFLIKNAISVLGNLASLGELDRDYWRNYY